MGGMSLFEAIWEIFQTKPIPFFLVLYAFGIVWFTMGLCCYHTYLIVTQQTTYEQIKGVYNGQGHPFDRGLVGNFWIMLCQKVRPRYFDPVAMGVLQKSA